MRNDKIQTGLRIPQARYDELKERAEQAGLSINALLLYLIDVGISAVDRGVELQARAELRNQK